MDWETIIIISIPFILIGIMMSAMLIKDCIKCLFPCASEGPILHNTGLIEPDSRDWLFCRDCGITWYEFDRLYSIASDGDSDSYIPVWKRMEYSQKEQCQTWRQRNEV